MQPLRLSRLSFFILLLAAAGLRAAGSLEKEVNLLGMGRHFELWDAQIYAAKEQAAIAEGMPERMPALATE